MKKKDHCCESETYDVAECACKKERKEFCVVYTMEGEERHVVIMAKDELDALYQFYNTTKILNSITGIDNSFIINRVYQGC